MNTHSYIFYDNLFNVKSFGRHVLGAFELCPIGADENVDPDKANKLTEMVCNILTNAAVVYNENLVAYIETYCAVRDNLGECSDIDEALSMLEHWEIEDESKVEEEPNTCVVYDVSILKKGE